MILKSSMSMKEKRKLSLWVPWVAILIAMLGTACEDDDPNGSGGSLAVDLSSIDFGNVEVGTTVTEDFIVTSSGLNAVLVVSAVGEDLTATPVTSIVSGATSSDTVDVTFSPAEEAGAGSFTGSIELFAGGVTQSVPVSANITSTPTLIFGTSSIDFGEVIPGSSQSRDFTLTGARLTTGVTLSANGSGLSVDPAVIDDANGDNTITVTLAPADDAPEGVFNGSIEVSDGTITETLPVVASVTNVVIGLPVGTVVYSNDMEFGLDHEADATESDFSNAGMTDPTVSVAYSIMPRNDVTNRIRTNKTSSRCPDNSIGDCGNAMRFTGMGSTVNIALSGLEAGRSYEVSYWVRPDGSSDRSMDVTVTGDTSPAFENWGGFDDRSFYRQVTRTGVADGSGNLEINFEFSFDNTSRTISIDDLEVVAQ